MEKTYRFESVNMGTVSVSVVGEWRDGSKDLQVEVGDSCTEFDEIDGGSAEDVIMWLLREGVEFESTRSMWYNSHYIGEVMLDGAATEAQILDDAANKTDDELARWREVWIDD